MKNLDVGRLFAEMATLLEVKGDSVFRMRAHQRAARTLEALVEDVEAVAARGDLKTLPGVGYFTGSRDHTVRVREIASRRGLRVSEYDVFAGKTGARVAGETEEDVYAAVGLAWMPPELRENAGEIEAAQAGRLPRLVTVGDLRGDLHAHTEWSDGHHPLEDLLEAAQARGYEYVRAAVHSRFKQTRERMTARIVRALDHPLVNILATPRAAASARASPTTSTWRPCWPRPGGTARPWRSIARPSGSI